MFPLKKAKWTAQQIPDQTGKVIIVTGGNSGELLLFDQYDHV